MTLIPIDKVGSTTVDAQKVQIMDGNGDQITSFGGGTQYTEGDTDATIAGTAMLMEGAGNALVPAQGTAADGLLVNLGTNNDVTVTGSVTANAGTNLNTSALALEATATSIKTAVEIIDNAISGNEMQVDVLTMPTTTVQATNLDIRDIDKASDDILIYANTAKDGSGTSYVPLTDTDGHLQIDILSMPAGGSGLTDAELRATPVPVSVSGVSTAAKQDTMITALQLIDDTVQVLGTDTYTEATSKGLTIGAVRRDADTTLVNTTNEFGPLQMDANGRLKVEAFSGETLPVSGTVTANLAAGTNNIGDVDILTIAAGDNNIGNVDIVTMPTVTVNTHAVTVASGGIASGAIASGAIASGAIASGAIAVGAIAAGATSIATTEDSASAAADHLVKVAAVRLDTPVANAAVSNDGDYTSPILDNFRKLWVTGTVPEDTAHVAGEAIVQGGVRRIDTAATSAGASGDWATMDASAEGALWGTLTPTTTSGCTIFRSLDIDETEEEIKATAGNLYGYYFGNATASVRYLKFYNATAANVTVGSTAPVLTFLIPASAAGHIGFPYPVSFGTAITVACTTGLADADTGAPGANDVIINVFYK